jgi:hypothetical protein
VPPSVLSHSCYSYLQLQYVPLDLSSSHSCYSITQKQKRKENAGLGSIGYNILDGNAIASSKSHSSANDDRIFGLLVVVVVQHKQQNESRQEKEIPANKEARTRISEKEVTPTGFTWWTTRHPTKADSRESSKTEEKDQDFARSTFHANPHVNRGPTSDVLFLSPWL